MNTTADFVSFMMFWATVEASSPHSETMAAGIVKARKKLAAIGIDVDNPEFDELRLASKELLVPEHQRVYNVVQILQRLNQDPIPILESIKKLLTHVLNPIQA